MRKSLVTFLGFVYLSSGWKRMNAIEPETFFFKDDGKIPNNKLPLLLYRNVFPGSISARKLKSHFAGNNWTNSWENGIYNFHHYHSTTHEVLGVFSGSARLQLGGEQGREIRVEAGDVMVIPAGVGHKNLESSEDFGVVGAYPEGREWDLLKGEANDRPKADHSIAALPIPDLDPLFGKEGGLIETWKS